ncbi:MAG: acetyl-CoA carboxylase, carboxyltransferase subunit beta, partial [Flavobacteriales bacterium]|nr:acetyl-CoA carboxylase, carboxyltransferase subunit beta [Flavobacteriales bacterium]
WYKSPTGKIVDAEELAKNFYVSPEDGYHVRVGSIEYFEILFDDNKFKELDKNLTSKDPLGFVDTKKYPDRLKDAEAKTNLKDAVRTAVGKSMGKDIVIACMDFAFIGGSMGAVVGEKITRAGDYALKKKIPFLIISKSGGARMQEAAYSLMQLAKTSAKLAQLADAKIPYVSLCTDPTTGGTTASFAMLGDINIAEPGALIGFAGPRVVRDTTGKELPEGFQTSEFLLEHGFLDFISMRKDLKKNINLYLDLILNRPIRKTA